MTQHQLKVAISSLAAAIAISTDALSSQGPGVAHGAATAGQRIGAAAIVLALGIVAVIGIVRYYFGWAPLHDNEPSRPIKATDSARCQQLRSPL
jgi:hypothetical protein